VYRKWGKKRKKRRGVTSAAEIVPPSGRRSLSKTGGRQEHPRPYGHHLKKDDVPEEL